jgi:hypothetical protein
MGIYIYEGIKYSEFSSPFLSLFCLQHSYQIVTFRKQDNILFSLYLD